MVHTFLKIQNFDSILYCPMQAFPMQLTSTSPAFIFNQLLAHQVCILTALLATVYMLAKFSKCNGFFLGFFQHVENVLFNVKRGKYTHKSRLVSTSCPWMLSKSITHFESILFHMLRTLLQYGSCLQCNSKHPPASHGAPRR